MKKAKKNRAELSTKSEKHEEPVKPAPEPVPVPAIEEPEEIDHEWPLIEQRRADGSLRAHLIAYVRAYATEALEEDDLRWVVVASMSDDDVWQIIEGCEYQRGAVNQLSRHVNRVTKGVV